MAQINIDNLIAKTMLEVEASKNDIYKITFAGVGGSGPSMGRFQPDARTNGFGITAFDTLLNIAGYSGQTMKDIKKAANGVGMGANGSNLTKDQPVTSLGFGNKLFGGEPGTVVIGKINAAAKTPAGRSAIDLADHQQAAKAAPKRYGLLIAELDGKPTGMLAAQVGPHLFVDALAAQCLVFYVHPDHRNGLTAAKLLKGYQRWAGQLDCDTMAVHVTTGRRMETTDRMLKKMGFAQTGGYYEKGL